MIMAGEDVQDKIEIVITLSPEIKKYILLTFYRDNV